MTHANADGNRPDAGPTGSSLAHWNTSHSLCMFVALAGSVMLGDGLCLSVAGPCGLACLAWMYRTSFAGPATFGWPNTITSLRVAMTVLLLQTGTHPHVAAVLTATVLLFDYLDGWLARRTDNATRFGARFDMESDAFLVAAASFTAFQLGHVGAFILIMGALRYAYVLLLAVLGRTDADAPRSRFGRSVFGLVCVSLTASLWPLDPVQRPLAVVATVAVSYSFARSLAWSLRSVS